MVLLAAVSVVGGCDSEPKKPAAPVTSAPAPDTQIVKVSIGDDMRFDPASISVRPGKVRVILTTGGQVAHTFTAPGLGVNSGNIPGGKSVTLDFNVPKVGEYPFYCAYHRSQGMTGTISAQALASTA